MTKDEEIFRMFHRVSAMTKMHPRHHDSTSDGCIRPIHHHPHYHGFGRLVGLLADEGELNQVQLASKLEIRPQSLSELLTKAESDGTIIRRQSEEDKRQIMVSLSDEGKKRVETFRESHRKHAENFLSVLNEEEKNTLSAILTKIIESKSDTKG